MLEPAPTDVIPRNDAAPGNCISDRQRRNLSPDSAPVESGDVVTTYMDEYATRLMNEAISVNYIDETEYPRIAVMNGRCINMIANL